MLKFAGIELYHLFWQESSLSKLNRARKAFLAAYRAEISEPKTFAVIKHLKNYAEMIKEEPALSDNEELAIALKYLPDNSFSPVFTKDASIIMLVKGSINRYGYDLPLLKKDLNLSKSWWQSVALISLTVREQNLSIAYELLDQITTIHKLFPETDYKQQAYACALQMAYYIEIQDFLLRNIGRNPLVDFYSLVENEFSISLNRLMEIPYIEPKHKSKYLCWSLLVGDADKKQQEHIARKPARVSPEF